jgi:hypothetical protein
MSENETQPEVIGMQVKKTKNKNVPKKAVKTAPKVESTPAAEPVAKKSAKKKAVDTPVAVAQTAESCA